MASHWTISSGDHHELFAVFEKVLGNLKNPSGLVGISNPEQKITLDRETIIEVPNKSTSSDSDSDSESNSDSDRDEKKTKTKKKKKVEKKIIVKSSHLFFTLDDKKRLLLHLLSEAVWVRRIRKLSQVPRFIQECVSLWDGDKFDFARKVHDLSNTDRNERVRRPREHVFEGKEIFFVSFL